MPSNKYKLPRGGKPTATSITASQRSSCEAVFYRFDQTAITKIVPLNIKTDRSLSSNGTQSATGNLNEKSIVVVRNDVTRCSITKNKGSSSGNFSLTLKRGKEIKNGVVLPTDIDYLKVIHPGNWVMIYLKKSGEVNATSVRADSGLKFLGIVENVRYIEIDDPTKSSPRLEYVITGRDFGKVFENEIFFNPMVNTTTIQTILGAKFLTDSKDTLRGDNRAQLSDYSPDTIIKNLVSFYLGGSFAALNSNNQVWYVPKLLGRTFKPKLVNKAGGVSFVDILSTDRIGIHQYDRNQNFVGANKMPGAALVKSLPATGTVWSVLQFMQNAALNEMYTELIEDSNGNLQPSLIMRQMPFSNFPQQETNPFTLNAKPENQGGNNAVLFDKIASNEKTFFTSLPALSILSSNIKQKNVGKSEHERVNHVIVAPKIDSQVYDQAYATSYNVPSVQRYGLRSLQTQTSYVLSGLNGEGFRSYLERCVNLLVDWFFTSHQLFNGTIIIDGVNDFVQIGQNLYIADAQQLYHIEGYTHTFEWTADGRTIYNTELRVSRGQHYNSSTRKSNFIGPSTLNTEPTTITSSVLEGIKRA